jgi:hypothetical protein
MQGNGPLGVLCRNAFQKSIAPALQSRLSQLHANYLSLDAADRAHTSLGLPRLTPDEMQRTYLWDWKGKRTESLESLVYHAVQIAWWNLQIAVALMGGAIATGLWRQSREGRKTPQPGQLVENG